LALDPITQAVGGNALWALIRRALLQCLSWATRRLRGKSPFRPAVVCLEHRSHTRKPYFEAAFASRGDALLVTIMSEHTLKEIPPLLSKAEQTATTVRVLTLSENTPAEVIEAIRKHLGENPGRPELTARQVREAAQGWRLLQGRFRNLTVREYTSMPTLAGVLVKNTSVVIELLPYNAQPFSRPALVLTRETDRELFEFFQERFEALWLDSVG
jgi:hypothetical protein